MMPDLAWRLAAAVGALALILQLWLAAAPGYPHRYCPTAGHIVMGHCR